MSTHERTQTAENDRVLDNEAQQQITGGVRETGYRPWSGRITGTYELSKLMLNKTTLVKLDEQLLDDSIAQVASGGPHTVYPCAR